MMAGPDGCVAAGQVVPVSDEEAERLIAGNYAEAVDEPKAKAKPVEKPAVVEEATAPPAERAVGPGGNRKGKGNRSKRGKR